MFLEYPTSVEQCLLLLDVSKEGYDGELGKENERPQKEASSSLQKHPLIRVA